jgi:hypothetical protein
MFYNTGPSIVCETLEERGRYLIGETITSVWAEFSTLSWRVLLRSRVRRLLRIQPILVLKGLARFCRVYVLVCRGICSIKLFSGVINVAAK